MLSPLSEHPRTAACSQQLLTHKKGQVKHSNPQTAVLNGRSNQGAVKQAGLALLTSYVEEDSIPINMRVLAYIPASRIKWAD